MMNQRPFKFRVWDTETKTFLQELAPHYWHVPRSIGLYDDEIIGEANLHDLSSLLSNRGFVIQQFTGVFDSTGKEIYEGDIVSGEWYDEEYHYSRIIKSEVVFNFGAFNISSRNWFNPSISVIGNIFDDPDLLQLCSKN